MVHPNVKLFDLEPISFECFFLQYARTSCFLALVYFNSFLFPIRYRYNKKVSIKEQFKRGLYK